MPNEEPKEVKIELEAPNFTGFTDSENLTDIQSRFFEAYKLKQPLSAVPTYAPKNAFQQTCFYNGIMYANINNTWVAIGPTAPTPEYTPPDKSIVRAYRSTQQSVAASTTTFVNYDAVSFATSSEWDTSAYKFTAIRDGKYFVNAVVNWDVVTIDQQEYYMQIWVNNSSIAELTFSSSGTAVDPTWHMSDIVSLSAGDYLQIKTRNFGTGSTYIGTASYITIHEL